MTSTAPNSVRVRANGIMQHVLEWPGPADRTALVLHGYLDQAQSFVPVADALARAGWRVLAPDFRGHGRSAWVPEGAYYHFPDYIADVVALIDVLAPVASSGRIAVIAHSMGGTVATMFAGVRSERVHALALLEGMGPPAMPADVMPIRLERWLDGLSRPRVRDRKKLVSTDEAMERLRVTHGGQVPDAILRRVAAELTEPHPSGDGLTWRFDPLHQTTSPARFDTEAFAAFAHRIAAPVLLVDGGQNGMRHIDDATRRTWFAQHEDITLEGAGHMMHWTQPDALSACLVRFLARVG